MRLSKSPPGRRWDINKRSSQISCGMGGHDHEYINVMSEIKILGKQAFPAIDYQSGWYLLTFLIIGGGYASEASANIGQGWDFSSGALLFAANTLPT